MAAVSTINGVSIYNLSSGKSIPGWISASKKKALKKNEDFARRLELLQDFGFPEASQTLSVSGDGRYVVATGTYPPRVRVWDTLELSMKFERYMDSTPLAHAILSSDYAKLAFLHEDRNVEVHAAYGRHYRTRIPLAGRAMSWHPPTAELLMACSGPEVYRLSLEEGRFLSPLVLHPDSPAANKVAVSNVTALIGVACEGGGVELFDPRSQVRAGRVIVRTGAPSTPDATSLAFEEGGLGMVVGTGDGHCLLYDLRHSLPTLKKFHPYRVPVTGCAFHRGPGRLIISQDQHQIKIWSKLGGGNFTTVESPSKINAMTLASDSPSTAGTNDSGLLLAACEHERLGAFYIPQLGPAPRWASFLDALTEEVDNYGGLGGGSTPSKWGAVYDDFKFLTSEELGALGLGSLIGTPMLKAYMHGYFIDARLYSKVRSEVDPLAGEKVRAEKVKAVVEAQRAPRLSLKGAAPKVNAGLAARLAEEEEAGGSKREKKWKKKMEDSGVVKGELGKKDSSAPPLTSSILADSRFSSLFSDPAFAIEEEEAAVLAVQRGQTVEKSLGVGSGLSGRGRKRREAEEEED